MSSILVLDTETTGVDPQTCLLTELCWASVDIDTAKIVELQSQLVRLEPGQENPAAEFTDIPLDLSQRQGKPSKFVSIAPYDSPSFIVAYNTDFDKPVVKRIIPSTLWEVPWLCALRDWKWPKLVGSSKLVDVALAHGIGVTLAHRAFADVLTLCNLFERVQEMGVPLKKQLEIAQRPRIRYAALVPFESRHLAKEAGFSWDPNSKKWWKMLSEDEVPALKFPVKAF